MQCKQLFIVLIVFLNRTIEFCVIFQIVDIKKCFEDKAKQQIEFQRLLDEEVKILNEIERKRNEVRKEAHEKFMDEMLDKMGAPVKWFGYKSTMTECIKCNFILNK